MNLEEAIMEFINSSDDKIRATNELRGMINKHSELGEQPIDKVLWVPIDRVRANDYNPNQVANVEMKLLYKSIKEDGYTQPIVTIYNPVDDMFEIVDGFHRYTTMRMFDDIRERTHGYLPITVINKEINDRMASTIRHNRARGKHSVGGMGKIVLDMFHNGWTSERICAELGMEKEEVAKLKHITGFSKLFDNTDYSMPWKNTRMIKLEKEWREKVTAMKEE